MGANKKDADKNVHMTQNQVLSGRGPYMLGLVFNQCYHYCLKNFKLSNSLQIVQTLSPHHESNEIVNGHHPFTKPFPLSSLKRILMN